MLRIPKDKNLFIFLTWCHYSTPTTTQTSLPSSQRTNGYYQNSISNLSHFEFYHFLNTLMERWLGTKKPFAAHRIEWTACTNVHRIKWTACRKVHRDIQNQWYADYEQVDTSGTALLVEAALNQAPSTDTLIMSSQTNERPIFGNKRKHYYGKGPIDQFLCHQKRKTMQTPNAKMFP